jgi:threonine dehydratase
LTGSEVFVKKENVFQLNSKKERGLNWSWMKQPLSTREEKKDESADT